MGGGWGGSSQAKQSSCTGTKKLFCGTVPAGALGLAHKAVDTLLLAPSKSAMIETRDCAKGAAVLSCSICAANSGAGRDVVIGGPVAAGMPTCLGIPYVGKQCPVPRLVCCQQQPGLSGWLQVWQKQVLQLLGETQVLLHWA